MKATVSRSTAMIRWRLRLAVGLATVLGAMALGGVVWAGPSPSTYPGRPVAGDVVWGAAFGDQDPVVRHEDPAGAVLELHRTFFQWRHRSGYMITSAADDIASGRLPWVSIKTPSWADMAAGSHDDEIDEMLRALNGLPGTVWLTIHHEPEGGGGVNAPDDPAGPSGHVGMNLRVRERMTALGVDNVALAPILMTWTWDPASGRNPDDWWAPGIYDFVGVDHYTDKEASLVTSRWHNVREWAQDRGVDVAVGEWGMRGTDEAAGRRVHEWHDAAANSHNDGKGARVVALSAFDSPYVFSTGVWLLEDEQLVAFHDILAAEATTTPPATTPTTPPATTPTTPPATTPTTPPATTPTIPATTTPRAPSSPRFVDTGGSVHESSIELIAEEGITKGCNPPTDDRYCPADFVTRGQMAALLSRSLDLPATSIDFFVDDDDSVFEGDINRLAAAGITRGCNPPTNDRYCATGVVSRGQMAAFLNRALNLPGTSEDFFVDDNDRVFEGDINRLAAAGITRGCNPPTNNRFCPDSSIHRDEMATFLARGLGHI